MHLTGRRRIFTWLALAASVALFCSACQQIAGSAEPNQAAVASVQDSVPVATSSGPASSSALPDAQSTASESAPDSSLSTIEDHSTSELPPSSLPVSPSSPTSSTSTAPTSAAGPTLMMANDGFAVSIMVTTIWSRALVDKGARVGIRTIAETADQVTALRNGAVDLVQEYNSALLNFLDQNSDAISQSAVDSAISAKLPTGLSVLKSTPAKDDVLLTVSAATAAKYRLHSISDLAGHVAALTLLLPDDSSAKSFTNGLSNYYGLTFASTKTTDFAGAKTIAAIRTTPSVGLMDASQYQIDDDKFVVLTDPEHLFLTENFIPLIGGTRITPAMKATLNAVSAKLSVAALRGLRKKVATGQGSYQEVADAWLASVGLK